MFMSVVASQSSAETFPEIAGSRVVITGLTSALGVDTARGFAERKARLIIQTPERSPEMTEIGALLAEQAAELQIYDSGLYDGGDSPVGFAQRAAAKFGGIDTLINLISISRDECIGLETFDAIETFAVRKLSAAAHLSQIAANRMRVTWTEGTILNAVVMPVPQTAEEAAVAGFLRTALAALTSGEARRWSSDAICINAVGPKATTMDRASGACLTSEPDLAALALYLASRKGRKLTGQIFDAEGVSARRC